MSSPSEELGAIVSRLEDAARRLKAGAEAPSAAPAASPELAASGAEPAEPRIRRTPPTERRRLDEVLDGLDRANLEVRRARARLAELEARLGLDRAA